jgi:hypothetical protein
MYDILETKEEAFGKFVAILIFYRNAECVVKIGFPL